jgi:membrane protein implicated in regulation of membrane protease activity
VQFRVYYRKTERFLKLSFGRKEFCMEINMVVVWLVLLLVCIIVEAATASLVSIWFAFGCLVAAVMAQIGVPIFAQVVAFTIVSVLIMAVIRPIAKEHFGNKTVETNAGSLVGKRARVTSDIDNQQGLGQVNVEGMDWSARSTFDEVKISAGQTVIIKAIDGVKLIVEKANTN